MALGSPFRALLDALLPRACAACGAAVEGERTWCPSCARRVTWIGDDACPRCQQHPALRDGTCPRAPRRDPLDAAVAAAWLESPLSDWVHAYKYPARGLAGLAPGPMASVVELARRASRRVPGPAPELVVPVPLHPRRLSARGFNPALLLARAVARAAAAPVGPAALQRLRDTPSQTGLDAAARARNVAGALGFQSRVPPYVWLVDDVVTTGATVREAARVLRGAGARRVVAVCAARTPPPDDGRDA